ncbi:hypothetical protein [Nonomuraea endophytica]|uniref:hypothetical protein n=1 Tax=Nonomuraea endophytica TaxID=714136 RepID=UPI0037C599E8
MPVFDDVVWQEPAPRHGAPDMSHIANQLRSKPGETAMIAEYATETASGSPEATNLRNAINGGRLGFHDPSGTFRSSTRTVESGGNLYVRVFATFAFTKTDS